MTDAVAPRSLPTRIAALARGGTASVAANAGLTAVLRIVSSMTLTRLLSADAFGVIGILTSITVVLTLLSDVGVYPFVVRHKDAHDPSFLDSVWTLRLARSIVLTVLMALLSAPIARFMRVPELSSVIAIYGLQFLFEGLGSLAFATAVRENKLWRLTGMEIGIGVAQLVGSIILALVLHSYWALVIATLGGSLLRALFSYVLFAGSRRRIAIAPGRARELWLFSRFIALSSILTILISQSDKLILARLMPLAQYGLYAIATTLAAAPLMLARTYAQRILYPAYAAAMREEPPRLAAIFYQKRRWATWAYMAAVGAMIGGAPLLIAILYDARYASVVTYLELVTISTAFALPNVAAEEGLVATGRQRWILYANVARAIWLFVGGAIAAWTEHIMLLVTVFGTVELFAMLCYWWGLRLVGILRLREEFTLFGIMGIGFSLGYAVQFGVLAVFPDI